MRPASVAAPHLLWHVLLPFCREPRFSSVHPSTISYNITHDSPDCCIGRVPVQAVADLEVDNVINPLGDSENEMTNRFSRCHLSHIWLQLVCDDVPGHPQFLYQHRVPLPPVPIKIGKMNCPGLWRQVKGFEPSWRANCCKGSVATPSTGPPA